MNKVIDEQRNYTLMNKETVYIDEQRNYTLKNKETI